LEDMSQRAMVIKHSIYKQFVQMVKEHYSNLLDKELDTDEFLMKIRALLTDNASLLKDLIIKSDNRPVVQPSFEIIDEEEVDESKTGRNYWDYFTTQEDYESDYEDEEEEFSPEDNDTLIEIVASTADDYYDADKKRRGRPRKFTNKPPQVILPSDVKKRRGRPRKNHLIITIENLEALALETQNKLKKTLGPFDEKRKRGRPKKILEPTKGEEQQQPIESTEYLPTITELPPFELFSFEEDKKKRGRPRKRSLETVSEEIPITLSNSNSMLPDRSPIISDSLLSDTILPELPNEIIIHSSSRKSPKRKRGRPKKDESTLLEDSSTHQSNSDIENVSSPSSLDSPMIGATFDTHVFDDDDDESIYDDELNYENSNSNSSPIPSSPQQLFVQDDSPQKKPRGRPRKKQENDSGSDTSSELNNKKTRHSRNKITDFFEEDENYLDNEFSKSKKKRRNSMDLSGENKKKFTKRHEGKSSRVPLIVK